jgi:hypothetical protein
MVMHRTSLFAVVVSTWLAVPLVAQAAAQRPVKVFVLAGQSNMEGYGGLQTIDDLGNNPAGKHLLPKIRHADGSYVVRDDVFVYYRRGDELIAGPLTVGQGAHPDRIGPELMFGIDMGDWLQAPVLLIKTAWGGKDLYCDFRPPGAGRPAYAIPGEPRESGACFRKMVAEVHECLDRLDQHFPQFRGQSYELSGFVWFQGWNDMCANESIRPQVLAEYAGNFVHLVQDLRAEFKVPQLPVVVGEVGVGGEKVGREMAELRAAQARIVARPELTGTLGYVRTAPYWFAELDALPRQLASEEQRVHQQVAEQVKADAQGRHETLEGKQLEERVSQAMDKALAADAGYAKVRAEHDRHVSHWECHYQGSFAVYALIGDGLAAAMKPLVKD